MQNLKYSTGVLAPLHKLTGLRTLLLATQQEGGQGLETVGQLTGLRELRLDAPWSADGLLLHLKRLHHLTKVDFTGQLRGEPCVFWHWPTRNKQVEAMCSLRNVSVVGYGVSFTS
jgi:hypothetical protein